LPRRRGNAIERLTKDGRHRLDTALGTLRVQSVIFCRSELRAPWGFAVRPRDACVFHIVLDGRCWLEAGERQPLELRAGDLVLLPKGAAHVVRDDPASAVEWLEDLLAREPFDGSLRHGGAGPRTELLCGGFTITGKQANPLAAALPDVLRLSSRSGPLAATVELVRAELATTAPGVDATVARLAEVLLLQAVRAALERTPPAGLRALADPEIGRALSLVHERPEDPWTVASLASAVALSRSAFAGRFRALVGEPPMRYVRRCRLTRAADLLRTTQAGLAEIASRSGYQSEVSLSKAFKRTFATSPGRYRDSSPLPELLGAE
jgi:AraC-like DNA-binding protein/mannose-6-phosphate isomerase-like protein (cupin superfamily)